MSKIIKKYDERGNLVYYQFFTDFEAWREYDENNNIIHYKNSNNEEMWYKYDEKNRIICHKTSYGGETWFKYDEKGYQIPSTKKELDWIKFKKKEKEFNSREKVSRFSIMDI